MKKIIALLLSVIIVLCLTSCRELPEERSSIVTSEIVVIESTASDEAPTPTSSEQESTEVSTQELEKAPTSAEPTPTVSQQATASITSSTNNSGGLSWGENKVVHPVSGLPFKDRANPNTGLSWDGVSPIIYTYPDGTTSNEPKDGATYEYLPGHIQTYRVMRDGIGRELGTTCADCGKTVGSYSGGTRCEQNARAFYCCCCATYVKAYTCHTCAVIIEETPYCTYCGKVEGNGLKGTCVRYWAGGEHDCIWCGETIPSRACHTCTQGCRYCGKLMGNGLNGTCYRDYFGSSMCPSCGAHVPINTCHACDE